MATNDFNGTSLDAQPPRETIAYAFHRWRISFEFFWYCTGRLITRLLGGEK